MQQITNIAALRDFTPITSESRLIRHLWTLEAVTEVSSLPAAREPWIKDLCRELQFDLGADVIFDDGSLYLIKKDRIAVIPSDWTLDNFTTEKKDS